MELNNSIYHLQKLLRSFSSRGMLKKEYTHSVNELSTFLKEHSASRRSLIYYLFLNSNEVSNEASILDSNLGVFIGAVPKISLNWLLPILHCLKMEQFTMEIVKFAYKTLSTVVLQSALHTDFYKGDKLAVIDLFLHYFSNKCRNFETDALGEEFTSVLNDFVDNVRNSMSPVEIHKYINLCWNFSSSSENLDDGILEFYNASPKDFKFNEKIFKILLDYLTMILLDVSLQTYILWLDIYDDNQSSYQSKIGLEIYKLSEKISEIDFVAEESLINCFKHLSIKPKSVDDELEEMDVFGLQTLLETETEDKLPKVYQTLVKKDLFEETTFTETCLKYIKYATHPVEVIQKCSFTCDNKKLILSALENLSCCEQKSVLDWTVRQKKVSIFYDPGSKGDIIEWFNKRSLKEELPKEFYKLVLINPFLVTMKLLIECSQDNSISSSKMFRQLGDILYTNDFITSETVKNDLISTVLEQRFSDELTDGDFECLKRVIRQLHEEELLPRDFLTNTVLPLINDSIKNENWGRVHRLLEFLLDPDAFGCWKIDFTVLLAYLANILKHSTFNYFTYDSDKLLVQKYCQQFILCHSLKADVEGKKWLRHIVESMPCYVMSYFYKLWTEENMQLPKQFKNCEYQVHLLLASRGTVDFLSKYQHRHSSFLSLLFLKWLPSLHLDCWSTLYRWIVKIKYTDGNKCDCVYASAVKSVAEMISLLARFVKSNSQTFISFQNCLRCFASTALQEVNLQVVTDSFDDIIFALLLPLNFLESDNFKRKSVEVLQPVLFELVSKLENIVDEENLLKFQTWCALKNLPLECDVLGFLEKLSLIRKAIEIKN